MAPISASTSTSASKAMATQHQSAKVITSTHSVQSGRITKQTKDNKDAKSKKLENSASSKANTSTNANKGPCPEKFKKIVKEYRWLQARNIPVYDVALTKESKDLLIDVLARHEDHLRKYKKGNYRFFEKIEPQLRRSFRLAKDSFLDDIHRYNQKLARVATHSQFIPESD